MDNIWVTKAAHVQGFLIKLHFNDGTHGILDLEDSLNKPVFEPLKDPAYFKNFKLNSWTIEWENGADFAPEFLYEQLAKSLAKQEF